MPNIKSAAKRVKVAEKKTLQNQMIKSAIKTYIKKFEAAVSAGNKDAASDNFKIAVKKLDQAACKNVIHKNAAARKKSQLATAYAKLG